MNCPIKVGTVVFILLISSQVLAIENNSTVSFPKIWDAISGNSPELKAKKYSQQAANMAKERLSLHWLPRIHAESRAFGTDDPTANFINILGERQVIAQDFNPSQLNTPGSHIFTLTTVGADLPLYEGGQSEAAKTAQESIFEAKKISSKTATLKTYSEAVRVYGEIVSFSQRANALGNLQVKIETALKKYRLGTKINPVGYSGLLSLKTLKNKITADMEAVNFQLKSHKRALEILSGQPLPESLWNSEFTVVQFLKIYTPPPHAQSEASPEVKAQLAMAEAAGEKVKAEKAKYLPQVGLFAQDNLYTGERGSSTDYAAGAYLRWSLGATDIGLAKEARLEASAARAEAQAIQMNDEIQSITAQSSIEALERTLNLIDENEKLFLEQWTVSETLFKNGSLTAHQLAEVISKTAEVIAAKSQTEQSFILAHIELLTRSDFDVSPENIWRLK